MAAGVGGWVFYTEPGLRWAIARAEKASGGRLSVEVPGGALARAMTAQRLVYKDDTLVVELRGITAKAHLAAALGGRLVLEPLRVDSVEVTLKPDGTPATAPLIPFGVRIGDASAARVRVVRGAEAFEAHKVHVAHFALGAGRSSALSAEGSLEVVHERNPLRAALKLGGTLERIDAQGSFEAGGASAEARARVAPFERQSLVRLEARARGVDLARFLEAPRTDLTLELKATGTARAITGELRAANAAAGPVDEERVPIAAVSARFTTSDLASAELADVRIGIEGGGELEGGGSVSAAGVDAALNARGLNLRALHSTLRRTELAGTLRFGLTRDAQLVRGTLSQAGMSVSAEAVRKGDTVEVASLHAGAEGGEVSGAGKLTLGDPLAFEARLALERFDPAAFGDYPRGAISGKVDASGHLGNTPRVDAQWVLGEGTLLGLPFSSRGGARVEGNRVSRAEAEARLGETRATARGSLGARDDQLAWTLDAPQLGDHVPGVTGRLTASGTLAGNWRAPEARIEAKLAALEYRGVKVNAAAVDASGTAARHELHLHATTGDVELDARLRGGLGEGLAWSGEITALEVSGLVPLSLQAPAPLRASRNAMALGRVDASLGEGKLLVRELEWSRTRLASSGEFNGMPARWLLPSGPLAERIRSTLLLDGQWSIAAAGKIEGTLRLRRSAGDLAVRGEPPYEIGIESIALDARFTDAGVGARLDFASRVASGAIFGQIGHDPAAGALGIGPDSALSVKGQIELASARLLSQPLGDEARVDGRVGADLDVRGTLGAPLFGGTLRGDALAFEMPASGTYLKNGELRATLEGESLRVERFVISGGAGTFTASGSLPLRFADGNAALAWQARSFQVLDKADMRLVASGEGTARFDGKRLALSGALRAERGHFEIDRDRIPKLGDDVVIRGQETPPVRQKAQVPADLDLDLDLGQQLTVRMYGVEGRLVGRVNVATAKDGELRAYGEVRAVNATFFAYGQRLQIDPGIVTFDGAIDNPSLQITAWRRNLQVEPGVQLSGTLRAPRVQLVSQPPVSEGERLSWLVLGRAPTDATKADLGLLQAAAGALLARGDSMPLDRRIARSFGLDEVSLRGSAGAQDSVLAFGKRFSDRLYVSYEQGLGTMVSNLVKMDYSLSRRWSVRAETGTSSGGGLFYRFSWD